MMDALPYLLSVDLNLSQFSIPSLFSIPTEGKGEAIGDYAGTMFGLFGGMGGGTFQAHYRCYPVSFMDKADAETGNKIFLPSSALDRLGAPERAPHNKTHRMSVVAQTLTS